MSTPSTPCRRQLYREAKRLLYSSLRRFWHGSVASLHKHIRAHLRSRDRSYFLKLLRHKAFAAAVALGLLTGVSAYAVVSIELSDVAAGTGGFLINGIDPGDRSGSSVSGAGDVNGDGLDDLIVGAVGADPGGNSFAGESYVVFGKAHTAAVALSDVAAGIGGFVINGIDSNDSSGRSVSGAGDVNGDGLDDLIVGAPRADPGGNFNAGESYVVFGKADTAAVQLSAVAAGTGGFVINGISAIDYAGYTVSGAGDVNGDGLDDLIVGAPTADPGGNTRAGESYVVFGKADTAAVQLSTVAAGTGGFVINGIDAEDRSGVSVSGAGDVNGDGLDDLIVGAPSADPGGNSRAGESYVVFGKTDTAPVQLSTVAAGTGGFVINGIDAEDNSGRSVSGAGDVNEDGLDDLIVGAPRGDPGGNSQAGESYVVFGKTDTAAVQLSTLAALTRGFVITGIDSNDYSGSRVSGAGDVNGDGLDDVIVGAQYAAPEGVTVTGQSYVVFSTLATRVPTGGVYGSAILSLLLAGAGMATLLRTKSFLVSDPSDKKT